jgi:Tfp pilus assembly protein PilW
VTDLAERYGSAGRLQRRLLAAAVAVLAVAGLVWLSWAMLFHGRPAVESRLVAFDVDGEHAVDARFTVVRRDADVAAGCLLRAFAEDHSVVGELNVAVRPSDATTHTVSTTVRTERRATSVQLVGCVADGQSRRR